MIVHEEKLIVKKNIIINYGFYAFKMTYIIIFSV